VALSATGESLAVGAEAESGLSAGVGGDQTQESSYTGAAYLY